MHLDRVKTEVSAQYVDHNLIQADFRNPDDHLFLHSACQRFGLWYSRPGNGVSHPVHMERFGVPGRTLLGSDSHTPAACRTRRPKKVCRAMNKYKRNRTTVNGCPVSFIFKPPAEPRH